MSDTIPEPDAKPKPGQVSETSSDTVRPENEQGPLSDRLDEALEETFPSSDPVSVTITK